MWIPYQENQEQRKEGNLREREEIWRYTKFLSQLQTLFVMSSSSPSSKAPAVPASTETKKVNVLELLEDDDEFEVTLLTIRIPFLSFPLSCSNKYKFSFFTILKSKTCF